MRCFICGNNKNFIELKPKFCDVDNSLCLSCGLVFIPRKNYSMQDYYKQNGYFKKSPNLSLRKFFVNRHLLLEQAKERVSNMIEILNVDFKNKKVLDIGCGYGEIISFLKSKFNCSVEGIEPSKIAAEYGEQLFNIKINNIILEEFCSQDKYDIIICSHTIEHVEDPIKFLQLIRNLISSNGLVYIEVPNILCPTGNFDLKKFFYNEHLQNFSSNNLNMLLNKCNLFVKAYSDKNFLQFWCSPLNKRRISPHLVTSETILNFLISYKDNYGIYEFYKVYSNKSKYLIKLIFYKIFGEHAYKIQIN